jgi:hypothetical protein
VSHSQRAPAPLVRAAEAPGHADGVDSVGPGPVDVVMAVADHDRAPRIQGLPLGDVGDQLGLVAAAAVELAAVHAVESGAQPEVHGDALGVDGRLRGRDETAPAAPARVREQLGDACVHPVLPPAALREALAVVGDGGVDATPRYALPEQLAEDVAERRADVARQVLVRGRWDAEPRESVSKAPDDAFARIGERSVQVEQQGQQGVRLGGAARAGGVVPSRLRSRPRREA